MCVCILQLLGLPAPPSENGSRSCITDEDGSHASDERDSPHINTASSMHGSSNEVQIPSHSNNESHSLHVDVVLENGTFQFSDNEVPTLSPSEEHLQQVTTGIQENGAPHEREATSMPEPDSGVHAHQNNTQSSSQHSDNLIMGFSNPGLDLCHE